MNYFTGTIPSRVLVSSLLLIIAFMTSLEITQAKPGKPPLLTPSLTGEFSSGVRSSGVSYLTGRDVKMRRGGCASFGHSCFGGHGKRAVPVANVGDPEEIPVGIQRPNDAFIGDGSLPQFEIFSRDEGQLDANGLNMFLKQQKYREPDDFVESTSGIAVGEIKRHSIVDADGQRTSSNLRKQSFIENFFLKLFKMVRESS